MDGLLNCELQNDFWGLIGRSGWNFHHIQCLLWEGRVIVPEVGRSKVLQELHDAHPGLTQMKRIARTLVWCPGLDKDVEERVQCCLECKSNQCSPPLSPLQPWKWPTRPGSRLHTDFVGPFMKHMFLIIIEAHSKWLEVHPATSMNATVTIQHMHTTFSTFRLPEILVTDNRPSLCAENLKSFFVGKESNTRHPYHPASNGLAERFSTDLQEGS